MEKQPFHKAASQADIDSTTLPDVDSHEESIPRAIVPWNRDDDRSRYLGLRSSGFTIRETLSLIGKAKSTLSLWRHDSTFLELENNMPALQKTLAFEYVGLEFLRNYRLILEKDYRVIKGSLNRKVTHDDEGRPYTKPQDAQDFQYLLKARAHYSPQQLQVLEQIFGGKGADKNFNWTEFVMGEIDKATFTREKVVVETRRHQESHIATISQDSEVTE